MGLILPESPYFLLALLAAITESVCSSLQPIYMGSVIDLVASTNLKGEKDVTMDGFFDELTFKCVMIICLDAVKCAAIYGRECLNNGIGDFARQKAQVLDFFHC